MNDRDFDRLLKAKARREALQEPLGFSERVDDLLASLPDKKQKFRRTNKRLFLIAAGFIVFTSMAVVASPVAYKMTSGVISYFDAPRDFKYLSQKAVFEQFNSQVGISTEDQGIKVTVDNLAIDDNYINVFYTVESAEPIPLRGEEGHPEQWRLSWTAPKFWFKADGRYIEPPAQREVEAYLENQYVLKGMQRLALMDKLPDKLQLELYAQEIFNKTGNWHLAMSVDKSSVAVESLTVTPGIKAKVTSGWNGEYKHDITIEKVSVSPFGSQVVISERGENTFSQFALRDDQGNYLTVIPGATYGGSFLHKATNSFEFIGGRTDMRELTLIPLAIGADNDGSPAPELKTVEIGTAFPIPMLSSDIGGFVLDSLEITTEKAVATFHQEGPVMIMDPSFVLLDEKDERIDFVAFEDVDYNRETGSITITKIFKNASEKDLAKIKKIGYFTQAIKLNEEEAIRIPLK